jgi:hypothetical protein
MALLCYMLITKTGVRKKCISFESHAIDILFTRFLAASPGRFTVLFTRRSEAKRSEKTQTKDNAHVE